MGVGLGVGVDMCVCAGGGLQERAEVVVVKKDTEGRLRVFEGLHRVRAYQQLVRQCVALGFWFGVSSL